MVTIKKRLLVQARGHGARFAQSASEGLGRVMTAQRLSRLVDDSAAKRVAGFVQTVRKGDFLAVVARDEWSAIKTANAIKADRAPRRTLPEAANAFSAWPAFKPSKVDVHQKAENIDSAIGGAAKRISARYEFGIQTHASLGPSGAVAEVRDGRLTVWSASQATHSMQDELAAVTGLSRASIRLVYLEGSGCYGRNGHEDATADAALIATLIGCPVRVQWLRREETALAPKCPPTVAEFEAGLDVSGNIVAWKGDLFVGEQHGPITEYPLLAAGEQGLENPKLGYDPTKDFASIHLTFLLPIVLIANPSLPATNVRELLAYLRANPGKVNYASAGSGGISHLAGEMLKQLASVVAPSRHSPPRSGSCLT